MELGALRPADRAVAGRVSRRRRGGRRVDQRASRATMTSDPPRRWHDDSPEEDSEARRAEEHRRAPAGGRASRRPAARRRSPIEHGPLLFDLLVGTESITRPASSCRTWWPETPEPHHQCMGWRSAPPAPPSPCGECTAACAADADLLLLWSWCSAAPPPRSGVFHIAARSRDPPVVRAPCSTALQPRTVTPRASNRHQRLAGLAPPRHPPRA